MIYTGNAIRTKKRYIGFTVLITFMCFVLCSCNPQIPEQKKLSFQSVTVASDANQWWARALGDINKDGTLDVVLQNDNGHGGWLGWYEAKNSGLSWKRHIIATETPGGGGFAGGDMEIGDIDNDGDLDILGFKHPGGWEKEGAPTDIFWYENPDWKHYLIGQVPAFIKDISLADFNGDNRLDIVAITDKESKCVIFRQNRPDSWTKVQDFKIRNLHEGMDVGDLDGDGDVDIATNGYWLENPGGNLEGEWIIRTIDDKWHNQTGDWSRNATKVFCRDITGDNRAEVFICHSERKGYPVSWYETNDPKSGPWTEHVIINEMTAAHTLQIFDMDLDGDYDVLAGVNKNRAKVLGVTKCPVVIYLNQGDNQTWEPYCITEEGIYNGQIDDLEGDGDYDIFRLPTHDAKEFEVLINKMKY